MRDAVCGDGKWQAAIPAVGRYSPHRPAPTTAAGATVHLAGQIVRGIASCTALDSVGQRRHAIALDDNQCALHGRAPRLNARIALHALPFQFFSAW